MEAKTYYCPKCPGSVMVSLPPAYGDDPHVKCLGCDHTMSVAEANKAGLATKQ